MSDNYAKNVSSTGNTLCNVLIDSTGYNLSKNY